MKKLIVPIMLLLIFNPVIVFAQKDRPTALVKSLNGNIEEVLVKPLFRPVRPVAEIMDQDLGTRLVLISPPLNNTEEVAETKTKDLQLALDKK